MLLECAPPIFVDSAAGKHGFGACFDTSGLIKPDTACRIKRTTTGKTKLNCVLKHDRFNEPLALSKPNENSCILYAVNASKLAENPLGALAEMNRLKMSREDLSNFATLLIVC